MKKVVVMVQVLLVIFSISACSPVNSAIITPQSKQPTVIHHTPPNLKVDTNWIKEAGCSLDKYNSGPCSSDSPLRKLGCEEIVVKNFFGGLLYPVVLCLNYGYESLGPEFTGAGCYLSMHEEALLMYRDGTYELVGNGELRTMSVPIESPDEALSYVLASTDYYPIYGMEIEEYYYYLDEIEETFIQETGNGYLLHLFFDPDPNCGCAEHYTDVVDVLVNRDGDINVVGSSHFYMWDVCVD